jgi:hypothetical protein
MIHTEIRPSLDLYTHIEHAKSLKLAADENAKLFYECTKMPLDFEENRIKGLGLFRSSMLLYAVSIELILKARALYEERENIKNGQIKTFQDFLNKWKGKKGDGHSYNQIIKHYEIDLTIEEKKILEELQQYTSWAGRFPFPKKEDLIQEYEKGKDRGSLSLEYIHGIEKIIEKQIEQM